MMLCERIGTIVGTVVGCTSHLSGVAVPNQANQYALYSTAYANGAPNWPAGDFNMTSSQIQQYSPTWFNNFTSAIFGNTYTSGMPYTQIDYIWYAKPHGPITYYSPTCDPTGSDHCFARAALS